MAPKHDLSDKNAPGKKKARISITLEQKMDILRWCDRGELTAAIRNMLNLLNQRYLRPGRTGRRVPQL